MKPEQIDRLRKLLAKRKRQGGNLVILEMHELADLLMMERALFIEASTTASHAILIVLAHRNQITDEALIATNACLNEALEIASNIGAR